MYWRGVWELYSSGCEKYSWGSDSWCDILEKNKIKFWIDHVRGYKSERDGREGSLDTRFRMIIWGKAEKSERELEHRVIKIFKTLKDCPWARTGVESS